MPMKRKFILMLVIVILGWISLSSYKFVYPPVAAAATAAQMDDTVDSFLRAKFIREGGVEDIIFWLFLLAALAVWLWPSNKKTDSTNAKN